ncbi:MAG: metallopeptidase family protein [Candidatus Binatia bacterium]
MNQREFRKIVDAVLAELPKEFRRRFQNIAIIIEKKPSKRRLEEMELDPKHDTLYGLYEGTPISERSGLHAPIFPDKITIFSEPLLRDFPDSDELRRQIRLTVLHEVAHFFGMDEKKIRGIGY